MPSRSDLLRHEPFVLVDGQFPASDRVIDPALKLLGGALACNGDATPRGRLASLELLGSLSRAELEALRELTQRTPLFLFARDEGTAGDAWLRALEVLTGARWHLHEAQLSRRWTFGDAPDLWPFKGLTLEEALPRALAGVEADRGDIEPLVLGEHGSVFLRWSSGEQLIFVSLAPLTRGDVGQILKREFCTERFLGLFPLLHFARAALGAASWRTPNVHACFVVDDPNLRFPRYGFLDYERLISCAREHDFHTAIAMIPLDYRKTRSRAADLVRRNGEHLSLVIHGVDHLTREFAAAVPPAAAEAKLAQGLARMTAHAAATGIEHARAMTFPHGLCNPTWLEAMRDVGFDAAIASHAFPFASETELDDPLYELHPAQMTFRAFPMVNRFKAEEPKEELLFQAWLGKPLIVYTHHGFFRGGMEPAIEIVDFINRHVRPSWAGIDAVLRANYQARRHGDGTAFRVFSNRVSLAVDEHTPLLAVLKPGLVFPADETARLNGVPVEVTSLPDLGLAVTKLPHVSGKLELAYGPECSLHEPARLRRPLLRSRLRRLATELRDQVLGRLTEPA